MASKKILILSHKSPYPKVDGGSIAIAQFLELLLEQGHKVTFLCMETDKHPAKNIVKHTNLKFESIYVNTKIKLFGALLNCFSKQSYILSRFDQLNFRRELTKILNASTFNTVIFESLFTSAYQGTVNKLTKAKKLYRAHNIEHLIWYQLSNKSKNIFKRWYLKTQAIRLKKEELNFCATVESILTISESDRKAILKYTSTPTTTIGLHIDKYSKNEQDTTINFDFFHIGAMDWQPNQEGVNWIMNEVFPIVKQKEKSAEIHLAGRRMPKSMIDQKQNGYFNHGVVSNAIDFMQQHKVMIVPLFSGSGIRVKIIQGMAIGKCIISTSIGAKGILCTNEKNILIANTKNEFIDAMIFCINNPNQVDKIGKEAKKFANKNFSKDCIKKKLRKII